jgi:phospholipid/cholesterol/gamma-HCH transport system substrate-binding protein
MEQRFKFPHVHAITGTFVLVVLAVIVVALVFAGRSQRWFIGNVTLKIVLPEDGAAGIRQGSEVYFLGTLVGSVSDVRVDPTARMVAHARIRSDFFVFVRADSSAIIKKKFGVAGDSFFEISRGRGAPLREENASIVCKEQLQSALEAAVDEIRRETLLVLKKMTAGLDTWTTLGSNLITSREMLDKIFVRAEGIAAGVQEGKGTIGKLLNDSSAADGLQTLVSNANHSVDELQVTLKNLASASGNLQQASTNLPTLSVALDQDAKQIPALILQTQTSMVELQRVIEAMQRHWLLRKYVNQTNPVPLRLIPPSENPDKRSVKSPRSARGGKLNP